MDRDPGDFQGDLTLKPIADLSDDEFTDWLRPLRTAPGFLNSDDEGARDDASALADVAAGRFHDHAVVGPWLKTWGLPGQKPFKEWLAHQDG